MWEKEAAFLFLMIEDGVGGWSIFLGENKDIILMLLVCMYMPSTLINKRVDVEKEIDLFVSWWRMSVEGGYFQEGLRTIYSFCFCMYRPSVIRERVDVEKEADLMFLNKDECSDGVGGWIIFSGLDEDNLLILFLYVHAFGVNWREGGCGKRRKFSISWRGWVKMVSRVEAYFKKGMRTIYSFWFFVGADLRC